MYVVLYGKIFGRMANVIAAKVTPVLLEALMHYPVVKVRVAYRKDASTLTFYY